MSITLSSGDKDVLLGEYLSSIHPGCLQNLIQLKEHDGLPSTNTWPSLGLYEAKS